MIERLLSSLFGVNDFLFQMWNGFPGEFQLWGQEIINLSNQASYKKVTQVLFAVKFLILKATNYNSTTQPGKIWKSRHGEAGTGIILPLLLVL